MFALGIIVALLGMAQGASDRLDTKPFRGQVHPSIAPFQFRLHVTPRQLMDRITVRQHGRLVQSIPIDTDGVVIPYGPPIPMATLEDVDCDGYKDLLVLYSNDIHGNGFYLLYRYDRKRGRFVEYQEFANLALSKVECERNTVLTRENSGDAGCAYESGEYRWEKGELVPVRLESQHSPDGSSYTRTIRTWRNGKETVEKRTITGDDCHAP